MTRRTAISLLVGASAFAQAPLHGHVVDQMFEPVPAAEVWANDATDTREVWRSKADGSGEFLCPRSSPLAVLHATAPGRSVGAWAWGRWWAVDSPADHTPPLLVLFDADPLAGEVVDAQGRPVADAWLTVGGGGPSVATDASGRFRLEKVPLGKVEVDVVHERGTARANIAPAERERCRIVLADAGPPIRVRLRGLSRAELRGSSLALTGDGVANISGPLPGDARRADPLRIVGPAAGDDTFVVFGLGRRDVTVEPRLDGYTFDPPRRTIEHDAAERVLEFAALPTPAPAMITLRGTLVDDRGRPLPGVELHCRAQDEHRIGSSGGVAARTGSDGGFVVTIAGAAGGRFLFELGRGPWQLDGDRDGSDRQPGHSAGQHVVTAKPDLPLVLTARRGAEVRGRLLGANGEPAPFAPVRLLCSTAGPGWLGLADWTCTDAEGRFAFVGVGDGGSAHRVVASDLTGRVVSETFVPDRDAPVVLETLRLELKADLRLRVRDASGAAVAGADVGLRLVEADEDGDDEPDPLELGLHGRGWPTNRQGRARWPGLRAGKYEIVVSDAGGHSATKTLHVGRGERAAAEVVLQ
jgi:hypothetical protein